VIQADVFVVLVKSTRTGKYLHNMTCTRNAGKNRVLQSSPYRTDTLLSVITQQLIVEIVFGVKQCEIMKHVKYLTLSATPLCVRVLLKSRVGMK
jgi:hypothetical protein